MRTVRTKVYKFNELSEKAKGKAIDEYRQKHLDNQFYYNEIIESIKGVVNLFGLKTGREWSDIKTGHIDDNILEIKGVRLYKYIINNYGEELFRPKYIKMVNRELRCKQFICKVSTGQDGKKYTLLYSKYKTDNCCPLTGVCYDNDILDPVYNFLSRPDKSTTFEDLIKEVENAIRQTFRNTEDWVNSDDFIKDEIEANGYEFLAGGTLF